MKTLTRAIVQARAYELNGIPENLKKKVRGQRREVEQRLDNYEAEQREDYQNSYRA